MAIKRRWRCQTHSSSATSALRRSTTSEVTPLEDGRVRVDLRVAGSERTEHSRDSAASSFPTASDGLTLSQISARCALVNEDVAEAAAAWLPPWGCQRLRLPASKTCGGRGSASRNSSMRRARASSSAPHARVPGADDEYDHDAPAEALCEDHQCAARDQGLRALAASAATAGQARAAVPLRHGAT